MILSRSSDATGGNGGRGGYEGAKVTVAVHDVMDSAQRIRPTTRNRRSSPAIVATLSVHCRGGALSSAEYCVESHLSIATHALRRVVRARDDERRDAFRTRAIHLPRLYSTVLHPVSLDGTMEKILGGSWPPPPQIVFSSFPPRRSRFYMNFGKCTACSRPKKGCARTSGRSAKSTDVGIETHRLSAAAAYARIPGDVNFPLFGKRDPPSVVAISDENT